MSLVLKSLNDGKGITLNDTDSVITINSGGTVPTGEKIEWIGSLDFTLGVFTNNGTGNASTGVEGVGRGYGVFGTQPATMTETTSSVYGVAGWLASGKSTSYKSAGVMGQSFSQVSPGGYFTGIGSGVVVETTGTTNIVADAFLLGNGVISMKNTRINAPVIQGSVTDQCKLYFEGSELKYVDHTGTVRTVTTTTS